MIVWTSRISSGWLQAGDDSQSRCCSSTSGAGQPLCCTRCVAPSGGWCVAVFASVCGGGRVCNPCYEGLQPLHGCAGYRVDHGPPRSERRIVLAVCLVAVVFRGRRHVFRGDWDGSRRDQASLSRRRVLPGLASVTVSSILGGMWWAGDADHRGDGRPRAVGARRALSILSFHTQSCKPMHSICHVSATTDVVTHLSRRVSGTV